MLVHKLKYLVIFTFFIAQNSVLPAQNLPISEVNRQIKISSTNNLKESWLICGEDSARVIRIDSNRVIQDQTERIKKIAPPPYTCLLTLGINKVLIGTKNNYALVFDNDKVICIDKMYGLCDSTVRGMSYSYKSKRIFIETLQNGYVSIDSSFYNYQPFTKTLNSENRNDKILKEYHSNFLLKFVFIPVRFLAQQIMPELLVKETHVFKERNISRKQRLEIEQKLEPADLLFKRDNGTWQNYMIPLFWTHTGIYFGGFRQMNLYFKGIPVLNGMKPSKYIRKHYPKVYRKLLKTRDPIIESITKTGVSINPLRNISTVDYFAALRPNLSKEDKFLSLLKALDFYALPYDFAFDLTEKNSLICSGLIYKSFLPSPIKEGINFEVEELLGSPIIYPGDIVKKFDKDCNKPKAELQFILFYDTDLSQKKAFQSTKSSFRNTWKR